MKSSVFLLLMMSLTGTAFAEPTPAVVETWYSGGLYAEQILEMETTDVQTDLFDGREYLSYAQVKLTIMASPYGCNTTFLSADIIGRVVSYDFYTESPQIQIQLGNLVSSPDAAEPCIGVPPREVTLTLPLVNGYSANSSRDTVYTYLLPGPRDSQGQATLISKRVQVNQVEQTIEFLD